MHVKRPQRLAVTDGLDVQAAAHVEVQQRLARRQEKGRTGATALSPAVPQTPRRR
ncbi:MAG TPA: hypothetical protein VN317_10085 [Candidatus Methanoperedens sp.]|nr:hypothetical protein [Candidatus Methanoperedens sp.]